MGMDYILEKLVHLVTHISNSLFLVNLKYQREVFFRNIKLINYYKFMSRKNGALKKYFPEKGFGFIKSSHGDLFFHVNDSKELNVDSLKEGATLSYEEITDTRNNKAKAANVRIEQ